MPDPVVVDMANRFRAALLNSETAQIAEMVRRWSAAEQRLAADITDLLAEIRTRQANGEEFNRTSAPYLQLERYRALLRQTRDELDAYSAYASQTFQRGMVDYAALGIENAIATIGGANPALVGQFNRLPVAAAQNIAAALQTNAPVGDLLRQAWPTSIVQMSDALFNGVALGWNPRRTERAMREGLQSGILQRALLIARTEQLRAYRTAALQTYRASGVVRGYKRLAARNARTCIACLVQDGRFYRLTESFQEHPNGRCTLVPVVDGAPEPAWEYGRQWFERQEAATQQSILGNAAYAAWRAQMITLDDLVRYHDHPIWGGSWQVRSLRSLGIAT